MSIGVPGAVASPQAQPGCGDVITHNTTLTADVGPCSGDGLVVAASNIALDLGGHSIFGASPLSTTFAGVRLKNVTGVTVRNGEIYQFAAGVAIMRGGYDTVRNLNVHDNNSSQYSADNFGNSLFGDGIDVVASSYNVVEDNYVRGNGPFSGISVFTFTDPTTGSITGAAPEHNLIKGNQIIDSHVPDACPDTGNFFGVPCTPGEAMYSEDIGVRIEGPQADFNTLQGNVITGSGREGVSVLNTLNLASPPDANIPQNTDTLIKGNNISGNGTALVTPYGPLGGDGFFNRCFTFSLLTGCPTRTTLVDNVLDNNSAHGIAIDHSQGNTVEHNEAHGNGYATAYGSEPPWTDGFDTNPGCDNNIWLHNDFGTVNQPCVLGNNPSGSNMSAGAAMQAERPLGMRPRLGGRAAL